MANNSCRALELLMQMNDAMYFLDNQQRQKAEMLYARVADSMTSYLENQTGRTCLVNYRGRLHT